MNYESGFGANGVPYEYTVAEKKDAGLIFKRVTLLALYVLYAAALLVAGVMIKLIVPMLALVPLTLWIIVFFTWRITQVEYEYSFFAGVLTVCRVLGGRSRKKLCEITIRQLSGVYSCDDDQPRIDAFAPEKVIFAASDENASALCAALWTDEDGVRRALFFEPNEKAVKILKYYNMSAVNLPNARREDRKDV